MTRLLVQSVKLQSLSSAGQQRANSGNQFRRDGHQRDLLRLVCGLDLGELFVLGLVLVMGEHLADALFIPAGAPAPPVISTFQPARLAMSLWTRGTSSTGTAIIVVRVL